MTQAEQAAVAAEAAHGAARKNLDAARIPLADAERAVQRLDTEAKTLMKLLAVESQSMWPPVIDNITVEKGYEIALGAALGDDLDAPVDQSHAMRWMGAAIDPSDPALPEGAQSLAQYVQAPPELARRLAQIGVVERADGARLAALLKPGQRLVSRDGDLWRWDGFAADAHAPTGAARRLAQRSRLSDIDGELVAARTDVEDKRKAAEAAQSALTAAGAAEAAAREHWRAAQREADNARELHAMAEREMARNTARISALTEAKTRLIAGRDEAKAAAGVAEQRARRTAAVGRTRSASSPTSAPRSKASARSSPRCAPRRRRWRARPSSPTAASTPSAPTGRPGATAATAPPPRSPRSTPAAPRPSRSALRWPTRRRSSRKSAALLIGEVQAAETTRARRRRPSGRGRECARPPRDRAVRAALEALGAAREEAARAEERVEGAKRRLTDIAHEIREMLECEPDARRGSCRHRAGR